MSKPAKRLKDFCTKPVVVKYAAGGTAEFPSRAAAISAMQERWPKCETETVDHKVFGDMARTLVWTDIDAAENDDGAKAAAEILPA